MLLLSTHLPATGASETSAAIFVPSHIIDFIFVVLGVSMDVLHAI